MQNTNKTKEAPPFRETQNEDPFLRKQQLSNPMMKQPALKQSQSNKMEEEYVGRAQRSQTLLTKGLAASTVNMLTVPKLEKPKARSNSNDRLKEEDVNVLYEKHEQLIETLLVEEDNIIDEHKMLIDNMINSIKDDSILYQNLQSQRKVT